MGERSRRLKGPFLDHPMGDGLCLCRGWGVCCMMTGEGALDMPSERGRRRLRRGMGRLEELLGVRGGGI